MSLNKDGKSERCCHKLLYKWVLLYRLFPSTDTRIGSAYYNIFKATWSSSKLGFLKML